MGFHFKEEEEIEREEVIDLGGLSSLWFREGPDGRPDMTSLVFILLLEDKREVHLISRNSIEIISLKKDNRYSLKDFAEEIMNKAGALMYPMFTCMEFIQQAFQKQLFKGERL